MSNQLQNLVSQSNLSPVDASNLQGIITAAQGNPELLQSILAQIQASSTAPSPNSASAFSSYGSRPSGQIYKPKKIVKSKKSWKSALLPDAIASLSLKPAKLGDDGYLEFGASVMVADKSRYKFEFLTPPLLVKYAALEGIGIKPEDTKEKKATDGERKYSIKLAAECDPELAKEDPSIVEDQQKFKDILNGPFKFKIASLLWKAGVKEEKRKRHLEDIITLYCAKNSIDVKKLSKEDRDALEGDPELVNQAIEKFARDMSTWEFLGDKNRQLEADGDKFFLRAKRPVFFRMKDKVSEGEEKEKKGAKGNKNSTRVTSTKSKGKDHTIKQLGSHDIDDIEFEEVDKEAMDDTLRMIVQDEMGEGKNRQNQDESLKIITKMRNHGYTYNRFSYVDCDGDALDMSDVIDDLTYKVVKNGDYVQIYCSVWTSSASDQNAGFGLKLQMGKTITVFRKNENNEDVKFSDGYKAGKKVGKLVAQPKAPKIEPPSLVGKKTKAETPTKKPTTAPVTPKKTSAPAPTKKVASKKAPQKATPEPPKRKAVPAKTSEQPKKKPKKVEQEPEEIEEVDEPEQEEQEEEEEAQPEEQEQEQEENEQENEDENGEENDVDEE